MAVHTVGGVAPDHGLEAHQLLAPDLVVVGEQRLGESAHHLSVLYDQL